MRALLRKWLCYQNDSMSPVAHPASVEGPLEAFLALALVLLHGLARRADLVEQDARHRRKRGAVETPLAVPEPGAMVRPRLASVDGARSVRVPKRSRLTSREPTTAY